MLAQLFQARLLLASIGFLQMTRADGRSAARDVNHSGGIPPPVVA
jgi:hypothetical protein